VNVRYGKYCNGKQCVSAIPMVEKCNNTNCKMLNKLTRHVTLFTLRITELGIGMYSNVLCLVSLLYTLKQGRTQVRGFGVETPPF